jgi:uncharacterized SAM-binding protein YcdF (DUF218 family)
MTWRHPDHPYTRPFRSKPQPSGWGCVFVILALCGGVALALAPIASWLGGALVRDEPPVHADAAVVLAGDDNGIRTLTAGRLVKGGYVPYAYLSGPPHLDARESDHMLAYAVKQGFPASYFQLFPDSADSTRDEAHAFKEEFQRRGIRRILLVTSNFHTRRAYYLFHKINPELEIHSIAAPDPRFSPEGWWKNRPGQKLFVLEWIKTFATWLGK